jgi:hypothetical protein
MKGIYLSEEGKKEIEAKITEIETGIKVLSLTEGFKDMGNINVYKEILSSATILPVEESWEDVEFFPPDNESQTERVLRFKNGVIIK